MNNKLDVPVRYDDACVNVSPIALAEFTQAFHRQDEYGINKYGGPLQYGNGRDSYNDALEELADATKYITTMAMEQKLLIAFVRFLRDQKCFPSEVLNDQLYNTIQSQKFISDEEGEALLQQYFEESCT